MNRKDFLRRAGQVLSGFTLLPFTGNLFFRTNYGQGSNTSEGKKQQISGVYPHLAVFNQGSKKLCSNAGGECGIGAVVPWQGKLWLITYSPHCPEGSPDKLYSISEDLKITVQPESIGWTNANRMIHRESNQLIIGPYFIDENKNIRNIPLRNVDARLTATTRHLTDPANKVYFYGMEGKVIEADVYKLETNLLLKNLFLDGMERGPTPLKIG
jgi:hypothetical protein